MAIYDFTVPYLQDQAELSKSIFGRIFLENRIKANKPCVIVVSGGSGEGKSWLSLSLTDILLEMQGVDFTEFVNDVVVHTPLEYPTKVDALLNDKRLKKVNVIILDEAREVIKASSWQSFLNQAIADINATSRGIKPMVIIVVTQYTRDIDKKVRRSMNHYITCYRPKWQKTRARIYRIYTDERDMENPKLKKKKVTGLLVDDKNHYIPFYPGYFAFSKPRDKVIELYENESKIAKGRLIKQKLQKLLKEMKREYGDNFSQVDAAVKFYSENPEQLNGITERFRGKIRLKKSFLQTLDFNKDEASEFQERINRQLEKKGVFENAGIKTENEAIKESI